MTLEERRTIQEQRIQEKKDSILKIEVIECKDPKTICEYNHEKKCQCDFKCNKQIYVCGHKTF